MPHDESVSRYPLEWPGGWVRTPSHRRAIGRFKSGGSWITTYAAIQRLEAELDRLGAKNLTLSTNVTLRLDGRPRSDEKPADPGAAVYFRFKGKATVFACDKYTEVSDNIAAIAAHIDALRRIDRYGVGSLEQALAGYKALPADTAADWRSVFGFTPNERASVEEMQSRFKSRARTAHPDAGGSDDAMAHLNRARDYALAELTN